MRHFRFVFSIALCLALLAGCTTSSSGQQANNHISGQTPDAGTSLQPGQSDTVSSELYEIPEQNTLQTGNPKTLSDWVFTNYKQTFSWRDSVKNVCSVTITLPALAPVSEFAIQFNEEIHGLGQSYLDEIIDCQNQKTSNILSHVTYEAYLHDDILSIVLIEDTVFDYTTYLAWSFDLEDQEALNTAQLCEELLDMDYPSFILATNAITEKYFQDQYGSFVEELENQQYSYDSYFESEVPTEVKLYYELLGQIPYNTASIRNRQLFVGENGQAMLILDSLSLIGSSSYPTIVPFDLSDVSWTHPAEETAYGELLRLTEYVSGEHMDSYAAILLDAFLADSENFVKYAARATKTRQEDVISFLHRGLYAQDLEQFQRICMDLQNENDLSESEITLVNQLLALAGN